MKRFFFFLGVIMIFAPRVLPVEKDPMETLIEENKKTVPEETEDELPPLFLLGDISGIEIYSPALVGGNLESLCKPAPLDELIEISRGRVQDAETVLNMSLPRVQQLMNDLCLIRPGDDVLALGAGFQRYIRLKDFVIKRDSSFCSTQSPYSLWMSFEEPLDMEPFLFYLGSDLTERPNHFQSEENLTKVPLSSVMKSDLIKQLIVLKEYEITVYKVGFPNCDHIILAKRRSVSPEENELINEGLFWELGGRTELMWVEKVNLRKGSGHIRLDGVWDYNGDGQLDVMLSGDHRQCPYQVLFKGKEAGFEAQDIPHKLCGC